MGALPLWLTRLVGFINGFKICFDRAFAFLHIDVNILAVKTELVYFILPPNKKSLQGKGSLRPGSVKPRNIHTRHQVADFYFELFDPRHSAFLKESNE